MRTRSIPDVRISLSVSSHSAAGTACQPDRLPDTLEPGQMTSLQKALVQGFQYRDALESGKVRSVSELARKEGQERAFLFRALSLVNLAPDIIGAIVSGMEPPALTLARLRKGIPEDWNEQRKAFGMV